MMKNIVLIGMMGSGKTYIGKALAKQLGYEWIDMDHAIETQEGMTIKDIFDIKGQAYFRQLETAFLDKYSGDATVISTGGGVILNPSHMPLIHQLGTCIYLQASIEELIKRLSGESAGRPLLQTNSIEKLVTERAPLYTAFAHLVVAVDGKTSQEIVDQIVAYLDIK